MRQFRIEVNNWMLLESKDREPTVSPGTEKEH